MQLTREELTLLRQNSRKEIVHMLLPILGTRILIEVQLAYLSTMDYKRYMVISVRVWSEKQKSL